MTIINLMAYANPAYSRLPRPKALNLSVAGGCGLAWNTIFLLLLLLWHFAAIAQEPPFILPAQLELNKIRSAVIYTSKGEIRCKLYPEEAPWHVANFKYRADKGLYRNTVFHIYYPGYIIQGGGPRSKPSASAGYSLPAEFNQHAHVFGSLGMARRPDVVNPQRSSSGNQFHILLGDAPHMNGNMTVFGQMTSGDSVLENLKEGDVIEDIKVFVRQAAQ